MGHFSVEIYASPGSTLSDNQHSHLSEQTTDLGAVLIGPFGFGWDVEARDAWRPLPIGCSLLFTFSTPHVHMMTQALVTRKKYNRND
jgi:hypothetical protein